MEQELLEALYLRYYREICLYLYGLCRNPELAEDLTQETFLKAILSLSESHENMRAWLYKVARNLYFNHRKREKAAPLPEHTGTEDRLLEELLRSQERMALLRAMGRLSLRKREVLQLQFFSGLPQKEIAALLGLTPANVRVLSLRARRELQNYLEEDGYDVS